MTGRSRAERKAAAHLRAKLALAHAYERIDYDYDVVAPKLAEIRALEEGNTVEAKQLEAVEDDGA